MILAEVTFIPMGAGASLSPYIAEAWRLIRESGLKHEFHSMGSNLEGEWDDVMALVRRCHERFFEMGAPRVSTSLKIGERRDKASTLRSKVEHVRQILDS